MPLPLLAPRRFRFIAAGKFGSAQNLIKLMDGVGLLTTVLDITANPKKLQLREIDAAQLHRSFADLDAAVINTNYAVPAGLIPGKDSIAIESTVNNPCNTRAHPHG